MTPPDENPGEDRGWEAVDEAPRDDRFDGTEGDDSESEPPEPGEPEAGYLIDFDRQERDYPDEYPVHMEILDEMEIQEILALDLRKASDYLLWAAAQSLDEQGRSVEAIGLLRRLAQSEEPHPALCYPEIRLKLHDALREGGAYEEALGILDQVERDHPSHREACRERRAEVLVLSGRVEDGLALFEKAARAIPDDPWVPLTAASALVRAGDYERALTWIDRGDRAARRLEDEQESRNAGSEVDRLRDEAAARQARREQQAMVRETAPGSDAAASGLAERRLAILADLDAEEIRLTRTPPLTQEDRDATLARLTELHRRASAAWDDAVERHAEEAIAPLEELQWEVVGIAERFGLRIPGATD